MSHKYIKSAVLIMMSAVLFTGSAVYIEEVAAEPTAAVQTVSSPTEYISVTPLQVVNYPKMYLNKSVVMKAKFDKFATLGLDYKPAFRSSDDYISFLIKRDDTLHDIPLSEMKLFLKR